MHDPAPNNTELERLAAQLATLSPRADWNRDRLMYAAGAASANRRLRSANRVLAFTSLALACVAVAVPLALDRSSDPPRVAQSAVPDPSGSSLPDDSHGQSDDGRVAVDLAAGPTHFHLRQILPGGGEVQREPSPSAPAVAPNDDQRGPAPSSRGLLRRYLQTT